MHTSTGVDLLYVTCCMGFCTLRRTKMDSYNKKQKKRVESIMRPESRHVQSGRSDLKGHSLMYDPSSHYDGQAVGLSASDSVITGAARWGVERRASRWRAGSIHHGRAHDSAPVGFGGSLGHRPIFSSRSGLRVLVGGKEGRCPA